MWFPGMFLQSVACLVMLFTWAHAEPKFSVWVRFPPVHPLANLLIRPPQSAGIPAAFLHLHGPFLKLCVLGYSSLTGGWAPAFPTLELLVQLPREGSLQTLLQGPTAYLTLSSRGQTRHPMGSETDMSECAICGQAPVAFRI